MAYPTGLIKLGLKAVFQMLYRSFLWLVLILVAYLLTIRLVVILLPFYQDSIIDALDEATGVELSLGSVDVTQDRLTPELTISDVKIKTEDESVDLEIAISRIQGKLSLLKSLVSLQPVFEEVYFYSVDFAADINELNFGAEESSDIGLNWLTKWFEDQPSIMLYDVAGSIARSEKQWSFDELDARWFERDKRYLAINQKLTPIIRAHYEGSILNISEANLHAEGEIHPGSLINTLLNQNSQMEQASLSFYVISDEQSLSYEFDTQISDYEYQAFRPVMVKDFEVAGKGRLSFDDYNLSLNLTSFKGLMNDKPIDSHMSANLDLSGGNINGIYLDRFNIRQASELSQFELEDEFQRLIAQFAPSGWVENIKIQGSINNIEDIIITGDIKNFSINSLGEVPGLRNVDTHFSIIDKKVLIELADENLTVEYEIFDNALSFNLEGDVLFQPWKDFWKLESGIMKASDPYQNTLLNFSLVRDGLYQLDFGIQAEAQLSDFKHSNRYVPFELLSTDLSNWLRQAFKGGSGERVSILYQENLLDFSGVEKPSSLSLGFWSNNGPIQFLEDWPWLNVGKGSAIYQHDNVYLTLEQGSFMGNDLSSTSGVIYHDGEGTRLTLKPVDFAGDNATFMDAMRGSEFFVNTVPKDILDLSLKGPMHGTAYLDIPFYDSSKIDVVLDVDFEGNTLNWKQWPRDIEQVSGNMLFDLQESILLRDVTGQTIGFPFDLNAEYLFGSQQFSGYGNTREIKLLNFASVYFEPTIIDNLRPYFKGETTGEFKIDYDGAGNLGDVKFTTQLLGLGTTFPFPFGKRQDEVWDSLITIPLSDKEAYITAQIAEHNIAFKMNEAGKLSALAIGLSAMPEPIDQQIHLTGHFDRTGFFPWLDFITGWKSDESKEAKPADHPGEYLAGLPIRLDINIDELDLTPSWVLPNVNYRFEEQLKSFEMYVDSDMFSADILLPKLLNENAVTDIAVKHFVFPEIDTTKPAAKNNFYTPYQLARWGNINIDVEKLFYGDTLLGDINLVADLFPTRVNFNDIHGNLLGFEVFGEGLYTNTDGVLLNEFNGQAIGKDFQSLFAHNNLPKLAQGGGPITIDYSLYWPGRVESINLDDLTGSFLFNTQAGDILSLEKKMNLGLRFLSVFNIENWHRRLNLDFGDVSSKGAPFHQMTAAAHLNKAQLDIDYAYVYGPGFRAQTQGQVDVKTQQMDLQTKIQLPVNTSDPFTCAVGLPVCVGGFIWELFTGEEFNDITNRDFRVTGHISQPQFEPIEN